MCFHPEKFAGASNGNALLGTFLSALLSNVTAPLLLLQVLKPVLRDMPTDSRYSRHVLLGLAFSCNIGGMTTPISSPQNVAALATLRVQGGNITWAQWLGLSVPFCIVADLLVWALLLMTMSIDLSADEKARNVGKTPEQLRKDRKIPPISFEREDLTVGKVAALFGAVVTLAAFAYQPAADVFGGTANTALLFTAMALFTGAISRTTFNSYSWHLLFLIGGGNALGLVVKESGLLNILTTYSKAWFSSDPWHLSVQLILLLVGSTTFVSHTVAALVLMPLVVELATAAGVRELAVLLGAFGCSVACALPMTSFPNVNSLMAADDNGTPWLAMRHFLKAGIPVTLAVTLLLATFGYWVAVENGV
eukprot:TRINITY_DN30068_c0_g1_i2.p1 TRINITY_DN30068_c0_g1~~TRINITY_DN30068_c0_g1_i2.p1  ORF type:complete len:364 (+),score=57.63 TRINITY_DN30068_c0_g1_i2:748-1839(+)